MVEAGSWQNWASYGDRSFLLSEEIKEKGLMGIFYKAEFNVH